MDVDLWGEATVRSARPFMRKWDSTRKQYAKCSRQSEVQGDEQQDAACTVRHFSFAARHTLEGSSLRVQRWQRRIEGMCCGSDIVLRGDLIGAV